MYILVSEALQKGFMNWNVKFVFVPLSKRQIAILNNKV